MFSAFAACPGRQLARVRTCRTATSRPRVSKPAPRVPLTLGDLNDSGSRVGQMKDDRRSFRVLEEAGTEPSVYYLKRVDPNAAEHS